MLYITFLSDVNVSRRQYLAECLPIILLASFLVLSASYLLNIGGLRTTVNNAIGYAITGFVVLF
jgi:hypothetical protein